MKKILIASASAIALFGLAACSDTDQTTTQSVEPPLEDTQPAPIDPAPIQPQEPMATPPADEDLGTGAAPDEVRPVE